MSGDTQDQDDAAGGDDGLERLDAPNQQVVRGEGDEREPPALMLGWGEPWLEPATAPPPKHEDGDDDDDGE
jgi:hypothetical protein